MTAIQIKCFITVGTTLNFTKSAEIINIAQPTLSKHINALEKNLGLTLIKRSKNKITLTHEGQILYEVLKDTNEQIHNAIAFAHRIQDGSEGIVRIGLMQGWSVNSIPNLKKTLKVFKENNSGVRLDIIMLNSNELFQQLESAALDIVIVPEYTKKRRSSFVYFEIYKTKTSFVMNADEDTDIENIKESLQSKTFITLSEKADRFYNDYLMSICNKLGFEPENIQEVESVESQLSCIQYNLGIALSSHISRVFGNNKYKFCDLKNIYTPVIAVYSNENNNKCFSYFLNFLKTQ